MRMQSFMGEVPAENIVLVTDTAFPRILVTMGGVDDFRDPIELDAEQFISVKGYKAIGKRVTTLHVGKVEELEPTRFPEVKEENDDEDGNEEDGGNDAENDGSGEDVDPFDGKSQQDVTDEMNGQLRLDFSTASQYTTEDEIPGASHPALLCA